MVSKGSLKRLPGEKAHASEADTYFYPSTSIVRPASLTQAIMSCQKWQAIVDTLENQFETIVDIAKVMD